MKTPETAVAAVGQDLAKEVSKGLADALKVPANEVGQYIADKIRFLRYKSLMKILQKAADFSKKEGVKLDAPAIKFLVPLAEAASLEDEDDDEIHQLWANLLSSSSDLKVGEGLLYINFLKNIGRREVEFLKELIEEGRAKTNALFISFVNGVDAGWVDESSFETLIERLPEDFDYTFLADLIVDIAECTGILFSEITLLGEDDDGYSVQVAADIDWQKRMRRDGAADVLESLGVLRRFEFKRIPVPGVLCGELFVQGYRITRAGIGFYEACTKSNFKHQFTHDVNKDQTEGFRQWLEDRASRNEES